MSNYISRNLKAINKNRLQTVANISLEEVINKIDPYRLKVQGLLTAGEIVRRVVDDIMFDIEKENTEKGLKKLPNVSTAFDLMNKASKRTEEFDFAYSNLINRLTREFIAILYTLR